MKYVLAWYWAMNIATFACSTWNKEISIYQGLILSDILHVERKVLVKHFRLLIMEPLVVLVIDKAIFKHTR